MGCVHNATPRPLYPRESPGTYCIGSWLGPRAGLDGCRKSRSPTRIRSPDCPARRKSLYWLSYPGPQAAIRSNGKEKILEFGRGRTRSHALENSLWTSLGTCFKTDYVMLMVTGVQTSDRPSLDLIAILTTLSLSILSYVRLLNIFFRWPLFYSIKLECLLAAQDDTALLNHRHPSANTIITNTIITNTITTAITLLAELFASGW